LVRQTPRAWLESNGITSTPEREAVIAEVRAYHEGAAACAGLLLMALAMERRSSEAIPVPDFPSKDGDWSIVEVAKE